MPQTDGLPSGTVAGPMLWPWRPIPPMEVAPYDDRKGHDPRPAGTGIPSAHGGRWKRKEAARSKQRKQNFLIIWPLRHNFNSKSSLFPPVLLFLPLPLTARSDSGYRRSCVGFAAAFSAFPIYAKSLELR